MIKPKQKRKEQQRGDKGQKKKIPIAKYKVYPANAP